MPEQGRDDRKAGQAYGPAPLFSVQTPEGLVVDAAAGFLVEQADQQGYGALLAADSVQTPEGLIVEAAAGFLIEQTDQQDGPLLPIRLQVDGLEPGQGA